MRIFFFFPSLYKRMSNCHWFPFHFIATVIFNSVKFKLRTGKANANSKLFFFGQRMLQIYWSTLQSVTKDSRQWKEQYTNSFIYIYHSPNNRKNSKERAQQSNANTWTTSHGSHKDIPSSCIQMHKCILNV